MPTLAKYACSRAHIQPVKSLVALGGEPHPGVAPSRCWHCLCSALRAAGLRILSTAVGVTVTAPHPAHECARQRSPRLLAEDMLCLRDSTPHPCPTSSRCHPFSQATPSLRRPMWSASTQWAAFRPSPSRTRMRTSWPPPCFPPTVRALCATTRPLSHSAAHFASCEAGRVRNVTKQRDLNSSPRAASRRRRGGYRPSRSSPSDSRPPHRRVFPFAPLFTRVHGTAAGRIGSAD